jgi:hypothetical protein
LLSQDQITLEELNVLDRLPHYCPVCGESIASQMPTHAHQSLSSCHIHVMMSGRAQSKQVTWSSFAHAAAYHEWNLDGLVELTWQYLDLLRIYTKPKVPLTSVEHGQVPL